MLIKSKKFWFSALIIFITSCTVALLLLNSSANPKKIAKIFNEYYNNAMQYTDEINEDYKVYLINNKKKTCYIIKTDSYENIDYSILTSQFKQGNSLFFTVDGDSKTLVFNCDGIKTHQATSFLNYCISQIIQTSIEDNYSFKPSSLEIVYPERILARFSYFEMTKLLSKYYPKKETNYLENAKYYFNLYTNSKDDYSDNKYYEESWKTLNVIGYSKYIGYLSINSNYLGAEVYKNLKSNYDFSVGYNNNIVPKFLDGEFAPVFALLYKENKDKRVDFTKSYFDDLYSGITEKKINDDLYDVEQIKAYYGKIYDENLNFVGETVTNFEDSDKYTKITLIIDTASITKIYKYITIDESFIGRKVQILKVDLKISYGEDSYFELKNETIILREDRKTITILIELTKEQKEQMSSTTLSVSKGGITLKNVEIIYNEETNEGRIY